ncbi:hypothetical protein CUMW_050990 [Citrus unshiu]|nr:hypothetical protein CUMW_050990 [Citrus unshiu]
MGQSLNSMNQHQQRQSKDELLYQWVITGDVDAIRALRSQGASLEWMDKEGKTPLIVACMDSGLINVAKTLIELGANINAYRPGGRGGTPLHHAAKRGLEPTVRLLLSCGANALVRNDDCHTALGVARIKGHINVVRAIESHICYFCGWLREFYGPSFLEALAPQLMSRKIWVVVIPCGTANPSKPLRFELVIYPSLQDVQPRAVIALWKAKIDEPKFHQPDPSLTIYDQSTKIRYKFASANEGDKHQLQWLYNACRGTSQFQFLPSANNHQSAEAINANGWGNSANAESHIGWGAAARTEASCSGWMDEPKKEDYKGWGDEQAKEDYNGWGASNSEPVCGKREDGQTHNTPAPILQTSTRISGKEDYNGWGVPNFEPIFKQSQDVQTLANPAPFSQISNRNSSSASAAPSAPPIPEVESGEGPIRYPSVENSVADLHLPVLEDGVSTSNVKDDGSSSSCVICWEAPVEGACVPCGHMAGCMSCLSEIKAKKGDCPVCRTKINQVIRLYTV